MHLYIFCIYTFCFFYRQPPPTMTLPSLCSAIRSQLYFSQISAWCDLIKKSDKTIYETGRIIYTTPSTTSAAGDLATTTGTTHNSTSTITTGISTTSTHNPTVTVTTTSLEGNGVGGGGGGGDGGCGGSTTLSGGAVIVGCNKRRPSSPRLNIFYRIKQYDSTACFNSKPNVHNFPNVNITESCSVSVCLKSLPRITGGIPKVGTLTAQLQQQNTTPLSTANIKSSTEIAAVKSKTILATKVTLTPTNNISAIAMKTTTATATTTTTTNANKPTISIINCDKNDNLNEHHQEQQHDKTLTSTSRCSYSSSCSINSNKVKPVSSPCYDTERNEDTDFEYGLNFDLNAGGDGYGFGGVSIVDCDSSNSSISTNNCGNLSHREKQLLKYRKRMMKRDKKQQQRKTNDISITQQMKTEPYDTINQMEEGHEDDDDHNQQQQQKCNNYVADISEDCVKESVSNGQRQLLPNNPNIINSSIPSTNQQQQQQHHVKMISTGTQTVSNSCMSCGTEKSMICLKCNTLKKCNTDADTTLAETTSSFAYEEMDAELSSSSSTGSSLSSSDIIHTPRNKAELLLQAIQRTPKSNKKHKHKSKDTKDSNQMAAIKQEQPQLQVTPANNSNHARNSNITRTLISTAAAPKNNSNSDMVVMGCQLCKRQKTQHNFNSSSIIEDTYPDENNSSSIPNSSLNSSSSSSSSNIREVNVSNSSNNSKASTDCNDDDASSNDGEAKDIDGGKMLSSDCVDNVSFVMNVNSENEIANVASTRSSDVYVVHETMEEVSKLM